MPATSYKYSDLNTAVNENVHGKVDSLISKRKLFDRAVRTVALDIDLRTTKRRTQLSPKLYKKVFSYTAPSDFKRLIDIQQQVERAQDSEFILTTPEEFDRMKNQFTNIVAVFDGDIVKQLWISGLVADKEAVIHDMESLTGNGTWAAVAGTAANNLTRDGSNFINGSASINFDIDTSTTTAAIENSTFDAVDLTDYENEQVFVSVYIASTTGLTNFILRWGSSSGNYYSQTVTTNHEGGAFVTGWNLLRFEWGTATTTGSPDKTAINYARLTVTLSAAFSSQVTDWRVDYIVARSGVIHNVIYYSRYLWQNSGATAYIENSATDSDYLNVETDEFNLIVAKTSELASNALREKEDAKIYGEEYVTLKNRYVEQNPSEAKVMQTTYYMFPSIEGTAQILGPQQDLDKSDT